MKMAEVQDLEVEEVGEIEAVEEQDKQQKEAKAAVEDDLPAQYRGKTVAEVMKMHQEAQKLIDRQASEVGEVRKLADELIKSQLQKKPEPEKPKEVDFFENPQEAIRQAVETSPRVLQAEQYAVMARNAQAKAVFDSLHPDAEQVIKEQEFADWVGKSSIRRDLMQRAIAFDVEAGDELLSTYKALKGVKQKQVNETDKKAIDQSLKAAAVETSGTGESTRKIYRRADLIRLKLRDPSKFDAMQDEIDAAYREGRVK